MFFMQKKLRNGGYGVTGLLLWCMLRMQLQWMNFLDIVGTRWVNIELDLSFATYHRRYLTCTAVQVVNATVDNRTLGVQILEFRGIFVDKNWYWYGVLGLVGYMMVFNILFIYFLDWLDRKYCRLWMKYSTHTCSLAVLSSKLHWCSTWEGSGNSVWRGVAGETCKQNRRICWAVACRNWFCAAHSILRSVSYKISVSCLL